MSDGFASGAEDSMIRSEERVRVDTGTYETGKVRLGKYIVTEEVTLTVPVSHEEFRLEHEPIPAGNHTQTPEDAVLNEEEYDIVLHAERPVVRMETIPVERIKVRKVIVTGEQDITEEVRKERIEVDLTENNHG
ncbi:YsnF/AvaK domain-containing protein [Paeniglutamicibacter antarcticus]|uniref:YsnF/AvaK domain-containing protein n=1 Tax=Arthrobacter terrae TaxID=2935737 RepID=A0A931CS51_9MICC|nr:YsnF/AvaK domain-containing protein [Arthrobacter terrae]MBG0740449.1 YsnF/AvaK domain-containing protein [Arthrobacter terrae]